MDYLVLKLVSRNSNSMFEEDKIRAEINKKLILEHVDFKSIYWDEDGDLMFHPPTYQKNRAYWVSLLNAVLAGKNWEFITSKF